jgi:hypothetical protein
MVVSRWGGCWGSGPVGLLDSIPYSNRRFFMFSQSSTERKVIIIHPTVWLDDVVNADDFFYEGIIRGQISKQRYALYMLHRSALRKLMQAVLDEWQLDLEVKWGIPHNYERPMGDSPPLDDDE